jgi:ribonuclease PH
VEVQGTAEGMPFSRHALEEILSVAQQGIEELSAIQRDAITAVYA